jgi:multiple sugar transport system substrate-binding protein
MIKIKQKWGLAFLLLLSIVYVLIFILDNSSQKKKVKEIYFADRITAAHKILIEKYNKDNEGQVKVVPIDFPNYDFNSNERKELLARLLRGRGDGIDVFAVDVIWTQRFAKWCEPLGKYFPLDERSKIIDNALESCYFEGELVAVPLNMAMGVMYYREDLLKKLSNGDELIEKIENKITWDEFIRLKQTTGSENPYYIFPAADYEGLICSFMELIYSIDPEYYNKHSFNLNTLTAKRSLQLMVDLVNTYDVTPSVVTKFTEISSYQYFIENDGLFIRGWQTYDKDFKEEPFNTEKEKYLKKAPLPYFDGGKSVSIFGGWNIMISKFSDKKDELVKFVKFLLSESSQEVFYKESGYYPIFKNFYEKKYFLDKYPEISEIIERQKLGVHRPSHAEYTRYSKIMSHYIELAIKQEISVGDALAMMTHDIQNDKIIIKDF